MPVLHYTLTLEEPVLLTALMGEPNSAVSYAYIPGSVIRGVLIGRAMQGAEFDPTDTDTRRRFFSASTRFLNAYIVERESGQRTLPIPLSWVRDKRAVTGDDGTRIVYDTAVQPYDGQTKSVRGFVAVRGQEAAVVPIARRLNVHTERPRRGGGEGTVYRYDALESGQMFCGEIWCEDRDVTYITDVLSQSQTVMIGGARSAGYGQATLKHDPEKDTTFIQTEQRIEGKAFILTLLSDTIVLDSFGQAQPSLDALLAALNQHGSQLAPDHVFSHFLDTTVIGGFNRKWGLPLPQMPALSMGSTIVFQTDRLPDAAVVESWTRNGIGGRREDGFGEAVITGQPEARYRLREVSAFPMESSSEPLTGHAEQLWKRIETRSAEQQALTNHARLFSDRRYRIQGDVTATQLARLRQTIAVELLADTPSRGVIQQFLTSIQGKYADRQYSDARIDGKSLKTWLAEQSSIDTEPDVSLLKRVDAIMERAQKDRKRKGSR